MSKMIDAQSIVVASTATNWFGHEGSILRYVFFHSIGPRLPGRLAGHVAGLCLHRYDRALIGTHKILKLSFRDGPQRRARNPCTPGCRGFHWPVFMVSGARGRPPRLGMTVIDGTGEIYSAACGVSCTELGP
jgi:hypothetical protein